jgi:hypothetical protein
MMKMMGRRRSDEKWNRRMGAREREEGEGKEEKTRNCDQGAERNNVKKRNIINNNTITIITKHNVVSMFN